MAEEVVKPRKLKPFERKFVAEVARGVTPTQALRNIGWKGTVPKIKACKMMARPHIRAEVDRLTQDAMQAAGINRAQIVKELARIAFADVREVLDEFGNVKPFHELDEDTAAAIAGMDVEELFDYTGQGEERKREQTGFVRKLKFWNKREALSELAAIAGLKREAVVQAALGPGLTVIVQQGAQVNVQQNNNGPQVAVNLPLPR